LDVGSLGAGALRLFDETPVHSVCEALKEAGKARSSNKGDKRMTVERQKAVTLKGNPFTLIGPELKTGDKAPDFNLVGTDLKAVSLADTKGKVRIFSVVPSLDTPVCDVMTRRFNQEAGSLKDVNIYTVSMDLPFAQTRWCAAAGAKNVKMLSDHRDGDFGKRYGTLIKELRLDARAIFVVDDTGVIRHVEYVREVADQPDYDAALAVAKKLSR
jgi:thiol peroxidase